MSLEGTHKKDDGEPSVWEMDSSTWMTMGCLVKKALIYITGHFFYYIFSVCVLVLVHVCYGVCVEVREQVAEVKFSSLHVAPRD